MSLPTGTVAIWVGATVDIPSGWTLCDGSGNAPDLRDKFVAGAGSLYSQGQTGGSHTVSVSESQIASHIHPGGTLSTDTNGAHSHNYEKRDKNEVFSDSQKNYYQDSTLFESSSMSGGDHTHTLSGNSGNTGNGNAHENKPPYYALAYIYKT